ncbi:pyruvate kinase, partial [Rhodococcus jostii]|uniref:pyruvate kinase n=1 Tax=Rhodococcus jostii TaxID=132919 RepID=UPI00362F8659
MTATLVAAQAPDASNSQISLQRTKIVCTLGPATATGDRIRELVESGMDVARL